MVFSPPDDHSRVVLTQLDGNPCSDYVNASYTDVSYDCLFFLSFTKITIIVLISH